MRTDRLYAAVGMIVVLCFFRSEILYPQESELDILSQAENAVAEKRYEDAVIFFQQYIEKEPSDVTTLLKLGEVHEIMGEMDKALDSLIHQGLWCIKEGDRESGIALFEEIVARYDTAAYNRQKTGLKYLLEHKYSLAKEAFQFVINTSKPLETVHTKLGVIYGDSGMVNRAIREYQLGRDEVKLRGEGYLGLVEAALKLGLYDETIDACRNAFSIDSLNAKTHFFHGQALEAKRRFEKAVDAYEKAYMLQPEWAEAHYRRGVCFDYSGKLAYAIEEYNRAITVNPNLGEAHYALSVAYYRNEQYHSAWEHIKLLRDLNYFIPSDFLETLSAAFPDPEK